jgi:hypothetical protein
MEKDTMTHLGNQFLTYSVVEVGWHDFLLGPTTSNHKLPPSKHTWKKDFPMRTVPRLGLEPATSSDITWK